jgi:hypothetical protein
MKIAEVLLKMGYKEFVVRGDTYEGIEWIEQPESIPTKEQILAKIPEFELLEQQEAEAKIVAKESAVAKLSALGLTEEEIKALLGGI